MNANRENVVVVKEEQISTHEVEKELGQFLTKVQVKEKLSKDTCSRLKRLHEWLERENSKH